MAPPPSSATKPQRRSVRAGAAAKRAFETAALCAALLLTGAASAAAAPGEQVPLWSPNGVVYDVAVSGSTAYFGGTFSHLAPHRGTSVALTAADASPVAGWPDVNGPVSAIAADGSGGWYLGGRFSAVGGQERRNLVHILADGRVDPAWRPNPDREVLDIAVAGSRVFVGGNFSSIDGEARGGLAELDQASGRVSGFDGAVSGGGGTVSALAVRPTAGGPVLYAGGSFTRAGTSKGNGERRNLAAFDVDNNQMTGFDAPTNGVVKALALAGGTLFAGGYFSLAGAGQGREGLAAFSVADGTLLSWDAGLTGSAALSVQALAVRGGAIFVAGTFAGANVGRPSAAERDNAASFNLGNAAVSAWNPRPGGAVTDLAIDGDRIYLVGGLDPSTSASKAFAVSADLGGALAWAPDLHSSTRLVAAAGGTVVLGAGTPISIGGIRRENFAALDLETGLPLSFDPNVGGAVSTVLLAAGAVWAAGDFASVNGSVARGNLAAFDPVSGAVTPFDQPTDYAVLDLVADGEQIYAAGSFTKAGGAPRSRLAGFRASPGTTGALLPFDPGPNLDVESLALRDGTLYLSGGFQTVAGQTRMGAAAIDLATGAPSPWLPLPTSRAFALLGLPGGIAAGGSFESIGGSGPTAVALLDPLTGVARATAPIVAGGAEALVATGSELIAGGSFGTVGGEPREGLAALDPATLAPTPWRPRLGEGATVFGLDASPDWIVAGGWFLGGVGPVRGSALAAFRNSAPDGGGPAPTANRTAPSLSRLRLSRRAFRVGAPPRRGTRVSFDLDASAGVRLQIFAARPGKRTSRGCQPKGGKRRVNGRPCTALIRRGVIARTGRPGRNSFAFNGRVRRKALSPGRYRLVAKAIDAAGDGGPPRTITFRVLASDDKGPKRRSPRG